MWGKLIYRLRWPVLIASLAVVVVSGLWGTGVFGKLTGTGFENRSSESYQAAQKVTEIFGDQATDLVVLYTAPDGEPISAHQADIAATLDKLKSNKDVGAVLWDPARMTSNDGHSTYAAV